MENINQVKKNKSLIFPMILGAIIIIGGVIGVRQYQYMQTHETTDDAQIIVDMSPVISKATGYIKELRVNDNQAVIEGDTLVILDNRDQLIAVRQAKAALTIAEMNLKSTRSGAQVSKQNIKTSESSIQIIDDQIEASKVQLWKATQDFERYSNLIKNNSITQQQYDQAVAAKQLAEKQLESVLSQRNQALAQTATARAQSSAAYDQIGVSEALLAQREVDLDQANLLLSYTIIQAPQNGVVATVPLLKGQLIQAGTRLFSLVNDGSMWIVANFKETQVEKMEVGQKVEVEIDAFPDYKFEGRVSSFSPATGSVFSILPPDNATGNFVKVVQRLPVKIEFVNLDPMIAKKLKGGMNVKAIVNL